MSISDKISLLSLIFPISSAIATGLYSLLTIKSKHHKKALKIAYSVNGIIFTIALIVIVIFFPQTTIGKKLAANEKHDNNNSTTQPNNSPIALKSNNSDGVTVQNQSKNQTVVTQSITPKVLGQQVSLPSIFVTSTSQNKVTLTPKATNPVSQNYGTCSSNSPQTTASNTVLAVKKFTQSDGTNEVFWAKNTTTFESWWRSDTEVNTTNLVSIPQGDIVDIDAQLLSNGEHLIYTATAHNVCETWWYPGQTPQTSEIIKNAGNIIHIEKTLAPNGQTQQLYVMNDAGVDEYSWNPNGSITASNIFSLHNPVAIKKAIEPDGTQVIYIADQNYVYQVTWGSDGVKHSNEIFNKSGITSIDFSEDSDGKHRLYVGTSNGDITEANWYQGGGIGSWDMTSGDPVVAIQKGESDATQDLYVATKTGVTEYWWTNTSNNLGQDSMINGIDDIHAFVRSTDPNGVQSVYTAHGTNISESFWTPGGDGVHRKEIE